MSGDEWDEAEQETAGGGGDFLKLGDGESATVAFLGAPVMYRAKPFMDGGQPSSKVLLNVFVASDKPPALKILDLAGATFKTLAEIRKKGKFPIGDWLFDFSRTGTGKKTRYMIMPNEALSAERKKKLASLELRDLGEIAERISFDGEDEEPAPPRRQAASPAPAPTTAAQVPPEDEDDIPF